MKAPRPRPWSRRKKLLLASLVALCILGLVLGLSIGLTRPRGGSVDKGSASDGGTGNSDVGNGNAGNGDTSNGDTGAGFNGTWPNPEPIKGVIPNNAIYTTLDPTLMRRSSDGKLFLLTTRAKRGSTWTADSLYGPWEYRGDTLNEQGGAPSLHKLGDTYYMFHNQHFDYATVGITHPESTYPWHDASIVVQTSKTMEPKSWARQGRLNITWAMKYNILDPAMLIINKTEDGQTQQQHLLSFGSYQAGLFQIPLADPPLELAADAMESMTHLEQNKTAVEPRGQTEAPYIYFRNGWYYLFYSSGRCCPERHPKTGILRWMKYDNAYRVVVCRSRRPREGYVDKDGTDCLKDSGGTLLLASHDEIFAPGGQGIMDDPEAGLVLYYHYIRYDMGKRRPDPTRKGFLFGWNKLRFDQDDWPYLESP